MDGVKWGRPIQTLANVSTSSMPSEALPRVTVFIPAYNAEPFIGEAIESVLAQTFVDFELLIIDDASTDATFEIARRYARDSRVRVFRHETNQGRARTRNEGLEKASGTYIALLDADDVCMSDRLEKQVAYLDAHPGVAVLGSRCYCIDAAGRRLPEARRRPYTRPAYIAADMLFHCSIHQPSVLARREALAAHYYDPDRPAAEDYDLWSRLSATHTLAILPAALTAYRRHQTQATQVDVVAINKDFKAIHSKQLSALGIASTDQDLQRHQLLAGGNTQHERYLGRPINLEYIVWAEQWLRRLIAANAAHGRYPEPAFSQVIGRIWLRLCRKAARFQAAGPRVWFVFVRSPLKKTVMAAWLQSDAE